MSDNDRLHLLEEEHARLQALRADINRDWRRRVWILPGVLLAIPAALVAGAVAAGLTLLTIISLFFTAQYLIGVRIAEYAEDTREVLREVARIDPEHALLKPKGK